jgi:hypothetical protein
MIPMKTFFLTLAYLVIGFASIAQNPDKMLGKWKFEEDAKSVVEIYLAKDGMYYGKIITAGDEKMKVGHLLFQKCKYEESSASLKGIIRPTETAKEMNVTINLESNGKLKAVAKKFFMSKTLFFSKVN